MYNNLKKEIEKDFNKEKNYNAILSKIEKMSSMKKIKYALIPICIVIIVVIGFSQKDLFYKKAEQNNDNSISNIRNKNWPIKEVYLDNESIQPSIERVPAWENMTICQQFSSVEYNSSNYASKNIEISDDMIDKELGIAVLTGYDSISKIEYTRNATLYSIKNLSSKCVIALKFENTTEYYLYRNMDYIPSTLDQLIKELNLKDFMSFETEYYYYWDFDEEGNEKKQTVEFQNINDDIIWQMLFDNTDVENVYNDNQWHEPIMSISVNIPILGYENISVSISEDGYLTTNILDSGKCFYIGTEKVQNFVNYVIENCDGYQIVYITDNNNNMNSVTDNTIEIYDVTNNTTTKKQLNTTENNNADNYIPSYDPTINF